MSRNPIARDLRTPKYRQRVVDHRPARQKRVELEDYDISIPHAWIDVQGRDRAALLSADGAEIMIRGRLKEVISGDDGTSFEIRVHAEKVVIGGRSYSTEYSDE